MLRIKKIDYDTEDFEGCETCDYGSKYIDEFTIEFENGYVLNVKTSQMYEHAFSQSDLMNLCLNNDCENIEDFKKNIIDIFIKNSYSFRTNELIINNEIIKLKEDKQKMYYINELEKVSEGDNE